MDIFKLFFEHDLRLDRLRERHTDRNSQDVKMTVEDFMKPIPTYSKFYLTGTRLEQDQFGLNTLERFDDILEKLNIVFKGQMSTTSEGTFSTFTQALDTIDTGYGMLISKEAESTEKAASIAVEESSNIGHLRDKLRELLEEGTVVMYKEKAHHGFDLHLLSKTNMYENLFYPFKELVNDSFRFFSINGKRIRSERHFYFETWTLDKPPHGAEEVFLETTL